MPIPKFREKRDTDDGCSVFQCLSCYQEWESRTPPEYGWKYCPYCGVEWKGQEKGRLSGYPRWQWELVDRAYENHDIDYDRYHSVMLHIDKVREKVEARRTVWLIESRRLRENTVWCCDGAITFSTNSRSDESRHKQILEEKNKLRDEAENHRLECIKLYSVDPSESTRDFCNEMYPEYEWRVRIMTVEQFKKEHHNTYIQQWR